MVGRAASRRWVNHKDVDSMVTCGTIPRMDCWTMHRFACRERARAFRCLLVQWICPPKDRASLLRKLRKLHQPSTCSLTLTSRVSAALWREGYDIATKQNICLKSLSMLMIYAAQVSESPPTSASPPLSLFSFELGGRVFALVGLDAAQVFRVLFAGHNLGTTCEEMCASKTSVDWSRRRR